MALTLNSSERQALADLHYATKQAVAALKSSGHIMTAALLETTMETVHQKLFHDHQEVA